MKQEFITIKDVASLTGLSTSTLYKLTSAGLIPYYKPTGKLLFKAAEIIEWVKSNHQQNQKANGKAFV